MTSPDRLDALVDAWCDEVITPEEESEIDRLVAGDRDMARRAALGFDLHRQLRERHVRAVERERSTGTGRTARRSARLRPSRRRSGPALLVWCLGGAAAAAALVIGLLLMRTEPAVWLEGDAGVVQRGGMGGALVAGAQITGRRQAVLCYADGTRIALDAGSEVGILDGPGKTLALNRGTLRAQVAPQPPDRPLRIRSAWADIEVVGTSFTLSTDGGQTALQVQTGQVRFMASGVETLVRAGESRRAPLSVQEPASAGIILISADAVWSYLVRPYDGIHGWKQAGFDESGWGRGAAPLGFDVNEPERTYRTRIGQGLERGTVPMRSWFRREFAVAEPSVIGALRINLRRDDGAVLYLNGVEMARDGMPDGPITPDTRALPDPERHQDRIHALRVPATLLRQGINCLAAEVHQAKDDSTDLLFELELIAEPDSSRPASTKDRP